MSQCGIVWGCSCNLLRLSMRYSYKEQPSHKHAVKFNKNHVSDLLFHHIDFVCKLVWFIVIIMLCLQHINRPISTIHIAQTLANNLALNFVIVHVGGKNNLSIFFHPSPSFAFTTKTKTNEQITSGYENKA